MDRIEPLSQDAIAEMELGKRLIHAANEHPETYPAQRNAALYCIRNAKRDLRFRDLFEEYALKALALNPDAPESEHLLFTLGAVFSMTGRFEQARNAFSALAGLRPEKTEYLHSLGSAHDNIGQARAAASLFRKAAEMNSRRAHEACRRAGLAPTRLLVQSAGITRHIGELALSIDNFVKAQTLGWIEPFTARLLAPAEDIVNPCLLDYWRPFIDVVTDEAEINASREALAASTIDLDVLPVAPDTFLNREYATRALQMQWDAEKRPPLLALGDAHRARGREWLIGKGMAQDGWFAGLHVRSSGYHAALHADNITRDRNADIMDYLPAIEAITRRGGWVVRVGDSSMPALPKMDRVIDYAHAEDRHDWLDVFLIGGGRFFVGTPSGPFNLAEVFGVPIVGTNWLPLMTWPHSAHDIFIHKLLRSRHDGRMLSLEESLRPPLHTAINATVFDRLGIEALANSPDDIAGAVAEMMDRLDGTYLASAEEERLQQAFRERFVAAGGELVALCGGPPQSRIAGAFLKAYAAEYLG